MMGAAMTGDTLRDLACGTFGLIFVLFHRQIASKVPLPPHFVLGLGFASLALALLSQILKSGG